MSAPLPWQQALWTRLATQRNADRLPHALLLAGPAGVGKRHLARTLAAGLLCQQPTAEGLACGQCRACGLLAADTHPDLLWLAPEENSRVIRIDAVRALLDFFAGTAQQGGFKLAVLAPAEAMNINAANALLKCLEEPAGTSLLMLVSDTPGLLAPTLRSRCQRVECPIPPLDQAQQWLAPRVGVERAGALLQEAGGRPLVAEQLLDEDALPKRQQWRHQLDALLGGGLDPVSAAQSLQDEDLANWLSWLLGDLHRRLRDLAAQRPGGPAGRALMALYEAASELLGQVLRGGNPNRQLALESLLMQIAAR